MVSIILQKPATSTTEILEPATNATIGIEDETSMWYRATCSEPRTRLLDPASVEQPVNDPDRYSCLHCVSDVSHVRRHLARCFCDTHDDVSSI
jgi:hypothetical protein